MRRALTFILLLVIAVGVAWWVAHLPGQATLRFGATVVSAPVSVTVLAAALLFLVLYVLFRLIGGILRLPGGMRRRGRERARRRGDGAVTRALVALASGHAGEARREAARARRLLGDTPQTLLLAAQAGRAAGQDGEAGAAFELLAARSDAAFLGLRGLLRQALARQDWAEAAALARRAEQASPGTAWLRAERAQLATRTGDWREALALAGPDAPRAVLATAAAEGERDPAEARKLARLAWETEPGLTAAALAHARRLREAGKEGRAQDVLRRAWTLSPQPDLAAMSLAPVSDPALRLREAGTLVRGNPEHPESRLLLAHLALEAGDLPRARQEAEAALAGGLAQRRTWLLLAAVAEAEAEGAVDPEAARAAHREALRHAAEAEPDPAWRCDTCGTTHAAWSPTCPHCGTVGRIAWRSPSRALATVG